MPLDRRIPGHYEDRHDERGQRLAGGTLACPRCDAPVVLGLSPARLTDPIGCPYCHHHGVVRDWLSLAEPTRPNRVDVVVRLQARLK